MAEVDQRRRTNPMLGRDADEKLMHLCEFIRDHRLEESQKKKAVQQIKSMNLRPYWGYCQQHLRDVGIEL